MTAGAELRHNAHLLAEEITTRHFERFPDIAAKYGAYGRRRCVEDSEFHLSFLAAAIDANLDSIFYDYVAWAKTVLASRGIATSMPLRLCSRAPRTVM